MVRTSSVPLTLSLSPRDCGARGFWRSTSSVQQVDSWVEPSVRPGAVLLLLGLALLAATASSCGSGGGSSGQPSAEDWRASARSAAATVDAVRIESDLAILADDDMEGRDNLTPGGERARNWLIGRMSEIGLEPMGTDGFAQAFPEGVNLVGRIPGRDPALAGEYVIVSGHYDHLGVVGAPNSQCRARSSLPGNLVCNGAADNAAGVAATLAVANALAHSEHGTRRSILVVLWDAEEDGLLGSRHFADVEPLVPLASIAAMFSVDNVGGYIIPGVEDSFAIGTEYASGLREIVAAVNEETGFTQWPVSSFFVGSDTGGRSDHLPFRLRGVPIIFFGSGSPPEYHSPADEIAIVSIDKLTNITRHVALVTADVANDDGRPSFDANPVPQIDDARALLALGEVVLADPAAVGFGDPIVVNLLQAWVTRLRAHVANPPQTAAEWASYDQFVRSILSLVYEFIGGADHH